MKYVSRLRKFGTAGEGNSKKKKTSEIYVSKKYSARFVCERLLAHFYDDSTGIWGYIRLYIPHVILHD